MFHQGPEKSKMAFFAPHSYWANVWHQILFLQLLGLVKTRNRLEMIWKMCCKKFVFEIFKKMLHQDPEKSKIAFFAPRSCWANVWHQISFLQLLGLEKIHNRLEMVWKMCWKRCILEIFLNMLHQGRRKSKITFFCPPAHVRRTFGTKSHFCSF